MSAPMAPVLLGLIGDDIAHSGSPRLHEGEARAQGMTLIYRLIDLAARGLGTADLPEVLAWGQRLGFDGFNVTHPYKQAVLPLLDDLSSEAEAIGSVNTIVMRDGRRVGHNTDWLGFAQGLRHGLPHADLSRVAMIGAGGAGVAVGYAVLSMGAAELHVHDADADRATAVAERLSDLFADRPVASSSIAEDACRDATGIIQATPIGMSLHPGLPIAPRIIPPGIWLADLIYTPLVTALMQAAQDRGCRVHSGLDMVVYQAAAAFELFTGQAASADRMRQMLSGRHAIGNVARR